MPDCKSSMRIGLNRGTAISYSRLKLINEASLKGWQKREKSQSEKNVRKDIVSLHRETPSCVFFGCELWEPQVSPVLCETDSE